MTVKLGLLPDTLWSRRKSSELDVWVRIGSPPLPWLTGLISQQRPAASSQFLLQPLAQMLVLAGHRISDACIGVGADWVHVDPMERSLGISATPPTGWPVTTRAHHRAGARVPALPRPQRRPTRRCSLGQSDDAQYSAWTVALDTATAWADQVELLPAPPEPINFEWASRGFNRANGMSTYDDTARADTSCSLEVRPLAERARQTPGL